MNLLSENELSNHLEPGEIISLVVASGICLRKICGNWEEALSGSLYSAWDAQEIGAARWLPFEAKENPMLNVVFLGKDHQGWAAFIFPEEIAICILPIEIFVVLMAPSCFRELVLKAETTIAQQQKELEHLKMVKHDR